MSDARELQTATLSPAGPSTRPQRAARSVADSQAWRFGAQRLPELRVEPVAEVAIPAKDWAAEDERFDAIFPRREGDVAIDPERAAAVPLERFYSAIVVDCGERMGMLARHRAERPMAAKASREARILQQLGAIVATGERAIPALRAWYDAEPTPSNAWAALFSLASLEGREPLLTGIGIVESFASSAHAKEAGEALALAPSPHHLIVARDLLRSPNPFARATGIEWLSRRGAMPAAGLMARAEDPSPAVLSAAIRGLARLPPPGEVPPFIVAALGAADPELAWEAARATTLWGHRAAYEEVRPLGALARVVGARALELFVMAGNQEDLPALERLLSRTRMRPEILDGVARFGHATTWAFLSHYLTDEILADAAARALERMFGPLVEGREVKRPGAWRAAIAAAKLSEGTRYLGGEPWSVERAAAEVARPALSAELVEPRLDELRARLRVHLPAETWRWGELAPAALRDVGTVVKTAPRALRTGTWDAL